MIRRSTPTRSSIFQVTTPLALPAQRIGVMGGSFNPPHDGHLIVAKTAMRRLQLDRIWWLVTPGNPLKDHDDLAPLDERMSQLKKFTTDPRMIVTAFEQQLETPFTAATLAFLKNRHPQTRFVWLMGADNLASFHKWQQWRNIFAQMPIAVVDRPGWHLKARSSPAARAMAKSQIPQDHAGALSTFPAPAWTFLTTRLSHLSSTELRREKPR